MKNILGKMGDDFKISIKSFKDNWKPFVFTNLFTLLFLILITFTTIFLLGFAGIIDLNVLNFEISSSQPFVNIVLREEDLSNINEPLQIAVIILLILSFIAIFIIIISFEGSLYGLAFEIFTSGNEFAEFKNAFTYFKKYWYKFVFLALFFSFVSILLVLGITFILIYINPDFVWRTSGANENSNGMIYFLVVNFLFFFVYPALIDTGSIKKAMGRNFAFIKKDIGRVLLLNLIFALLNFLLKVPFIMIGYEINQIFIIFAIIMSLFDFLVIKSIKILVITRAYNSILFSDGRVINDEP